MQHPHPLALVGALLLGPLASAQATWTVDPAGGADFLAVQAAVDAASEGDRIVLAPGGHGPFEVVGKSLTILSASPVRPFVSDLGASGGTGAVPIVVRDLGANQLVRLRGVNVFHGTIGAPAAFEVRDCAGPVWIEDTFADSYAGTSLTLRNCAEVVLQRCLLQTNAGVAPPAGDFGGAPGLLVQGCDEVRAFDCVLRGSHGVLQPTGPAPQGRVHGGDGVWIDGGNLRLEACTLVAGNGSANEVGGCLLGGDGGNGLEVAPGGAPAITVRATTFQGGPGSAFDAGCSSAPVAGLDLVLGAGTLVDLDQPRASWRVESPAYQLATLSLVAQGAPGDLVLSWYSFEPAPLLVVAGYGLHVDPFAFYELSVTSLVTALEEETTLPIPALPVGWTSGSFVSQALFVGAGGSLRLSGPTWTLVLP